MLCQVGLPRSKFDGREFMRQSGAAWINVQAGWLDEGKGPVQQPVPYGPLPRLALAWISTQAVRTKDREIAIGSSASEFLRLLGKPTTGGVRGSFTTLRKQMHALAACRLQLGFKGRTFNGQPVEQFDAWLANRETGQQALWPGLLVLSDGYFNSLVENAVPLDNRALMALSDSALALDVYTWLAHRLHRIEGRGVTLHWKAIREQFAQEYKGKDPDKDFKKEFVPAIKKVLAVYPQAKVKPVTGGVLMISADASISLRSDCVRMPGCLRLGVALGFSVVTATDTPAASWAMTRCRSACAFSRFAVASSICARTPATCGLSTPCSMATLASDRRNSMRASSSWAMRTSNADTQIS